MGLCRNFSRALFLTFIYLLQSSSNQSFLGFISHVKILSALFIIISLQFIFLLLYFHHYFPLFFFFPISSSISLQYRFATLSSFFSSSTLYFFCLTPLAFRTFAILCLYFTLTSKRSQSQSAPLQLLMPFTSEPCLQSINT